MAGELQQDTSVYSVQMIIGNQPIILDNDNIISCYFIEDIFKHCMMGKLVFNDVHGLFEFGPFTGNEQIVITYGIDYDKEIVFDIWKVSKITQTGVTEPASKNMIEIQFVDPTFSAYTLRKYSRSWVDTKITNIMRYFIEHMLNLTTPINIEESENNIDFVIPYWTVLQSMKYLERRAKSIQSKSSGYLVYNNTDNNGFTTNAYTLNYLFDDLSKTIEKTFYKFESKSVSETNKILELWISGLDKTSTKGLRGGTWRGYNINNKELLNKTYTYTEGIQNSVLLGKKSLYPNINDLRTANVLLGEDSLEKLENILYNDWIKKYCRQNVINIIVKGHEKRYAGQQIEIVFPSVSKSEKYNKGFGGRYLIKSITHHFGGGRSFIYNQRLVLLKNAYNDLDTSILVPATKTNIYTSSIGN